MTQKYLSVDMTDSKNKTVDETTLVFIPENSQKTNNLGTPIGIVLHWSAGYKKQVFDGYHFNIAESKKGNAILVKTLNLSQKGQHLWGRNTGFIGISLSCLATPDLVPSTAQLDLLSLIIAEVCVWKKIEPTDLLTVPEKHQTNGVLLSTGKNIQVTAISDHAYFAKKDGYYPDRWDIGDYFKPVFKKAIEYHNGIKMNKRQFQFSELLKK